MMKFVSESTIASYEVATPNTLKDFNEDVSICLTCDHFEKGKNGYFCDCHLWDEDEESIDPKDMFEREDCRAYVQTDKSKCFSCPYTCIEKRRNCDPLEFHCNTGYDNMWFLTKHGCPSMDKI